MVGRLEGKVERGRVGIEVGWENRVGGACGNDFGGKVCSPSRPLSGILSAWCTRSPCKCTVHEALGAITIPAVSALFIVNTYFRFMSIAYSLPPLYFSIHRRNERGVNAYLLFSAIFLLLASEIRVSTREFSNESSVERTAPDILISEKCVRRSFLPDYFHIQECFLVEEITAAALLSRPLSFIAVSNGYPVGAILNRD